MAAGDAEAALLRLLRERHAGATICPSEAARRLGGEGWRGRMPAVHAAAHALAARGAVRLSQGGATAEAPIGAYRIARAAG